MIYNLILAGILLAIAGIFLWMTWQLWHTGHDDDANTVYEPVSPKDIGIDE